MEISSRSNRSFIQSNFICRSCEDFIKRSQPLISPFVRESSLSVPAFMNFYMFLVLPSSFFVRLSSYPSISRFSLLQLLRESYIVSDMYCRILSQLMQLLTEGIEDGFEGLQLVLDVGLPERRSSGEPAALLVPPGHTGGVVTCPVLKLPSGLSIARLVEFCGAILHE